MQHQRSRSQFNGLFLTLGLPALALVSLLGATPSLAAIQTSSEFDMANEPVKVANLFDFLDAVNEGIQTIQTIQDDIQGEQAPATQPISSEERPSGTQIRQQPSSNAASQPVDEDLYQMLSRRSDEAHEEWYSRIDPIILHMPGTQYRAWKRTLSNEDREAFDTITRQRNYEAREQINQAVPMVIQEALTQPDQGDYPYGMSADEYYCYIDPSCGR
ncbi:MAG: hypothetical protein ACTS2F_08065 [Thainema sp.]